MVSTHGQLPERRERNADASPGWRFLPHQLAPSGGVKRALLRRALGSLTTKNLLLFLGIFTVSLAPLAYAYRADVATHRIANLATRLELIAEQSARRISPAGLDELSDRAATGSAAQLALVEILAGIEQDFEVDNAVLLRRAQSGGFEFIADGKNQFFVSQPVFVHDQFPETRRAAERAWNAEPDSHTELFGLGTFEYLQFNRRIEKNGRPVALLLLNKFAEPVDQAIRHDTMRLLSLTFGLFLAGALVFGLFSTRLLRPLFNLQRAADALAAGDLSIEVIPLPGQDEVARLSRSFGTMVAELRSSHAALKASNAELRRTLARVQLMEDLEKSLSKFVPRSVRSVLAADPQALERGKEERDVSVLFVDIEGSTLLTEALEARQSDRLFERTFSGFVDCIYEHQGDITETAGDGLMIIFQSDDPYEHALNALRTAARIQSVARIAAAEEPSATQLQVNIGVASGQALVGFTQYEGISGSRVTFTASGRTTIIAARLQDLAQHGAVLIADETARRVADRSALEELGLQLEDLGPMQLKNVQYPERVHRLALPADHTRERGGAR